MIEQSKTPGKLVKHIADSFAAENGDFEAAKVKVTMTPGDGVFYIGEPRHIADFIGARDDKPVTFNHRECYVAAKTLDAVIAAHHAIGHFFQKAVRDATRAKVIIVTFKANHPAHGKYVNPSSYSELSFAGRPALAIEHEVMWLIGDNLYRVFERGEGEFPQMTYVCAAPVNGNYSGRPEMFMLEWAAEREAFFDRVKERMVWLIDAIGEMLIGDTTAQVDRMIAGGGLLSLPAPEAESVA